MGGVVLTQMASTVKIVNRDDEVCNVQNDQHSYYCIVYGNN